MESFAELILNEKDTVKKAELIYYLQKKKNIFFDKSVILKAEIAKAFMEYINMPRIDKNMVLTAVLLCACKKSKGAQTIDKIKEYAKESADFLQELGFSKEFGNLCKMHNRYENVQPRTIEGDILELTDQLGGMILDRSDRMGYQLPEALELIEKNLKDKENKILDKFEEFVWKTENYHGKIDSRELEEKDVGIIGNEHTGLRAINKFEDDNIRDCLIFVQEWEMKNGLKEPEKIPIET